MNIIHMFSKMVNMDELTEHILWMHIIIIPTDMAIDSSHVQHVMPCYAQVNKTRRGSTVATEILCVDKQKEVSVSGRYAP